MRHMIIDRRLREAALIRVLRALKAASREVGSADLESAWREKTGLRCSDLQSAVRDMVDRGYLVVTRAAGTARDYRATAAGRSELRWRGTLLSISDALVLFSVHARNWMDMFRSSSVGHRSGDRRRPV